MVVLLVGQMIVDLPLDSSASRGVVHGEFCAVGMDYCRWTDLVERWRLVIDKDEGRQRAEITHWQVIR